jgi:hypothetical protein
MKGNAIRFGSSVAALAIGATVMIPSSGHSQYMINTSLITCAQYLAMPPEQSRILAAWMSGWFNRKMGYVYINLNAYARNVDNMKAWCASNPNELVMTGLQRATAPKQ